MRQTLFYIPNQLGGQPVFGGGWLLWAWCAVAVVYVLWTVSRSGWNKEIQSFLPFAGLVAAALGLLLPNVLVEIPLHERAFMLWSAPASIAGNASAIPLRGLPIRGYGVCLLAGTISGVTLAMLRGRRVGLSPDAIFNLAFYMFVGGIAGARLFYVIQYWDTIHVPGSMLGTVSNICNFVVGGLVVYGSLIGALVTGGWYLWRNRLPTLAIADLIAPSLALGLAIGRIGCLMNGCCFGGPCDHALGVTFPAGSPPYLVQHRSGEYYGFQLNADENGPAQIQQVEADGPAAAAGVPVDSVITSINGGTVKNAGDAMYWLGQAAGQLQLGTSTGSYQVDIGQLPARTTPLHPTQIYSSLNAALMCLVTLVVFPYRRRDGQVFMLLISMYAVTRFLLEVIRTDESGVGNTGMTISQNVSVAMLIGVAALAAYVMYRPAGSFWPAATSGPSA